ncbi:MAG TPA: M20 family metallopeptidase [Victivallales bacterium]|nr:M20 family metallopeptidase [Victivallales bacterium]
MNANIKKTVSVNSKILKDLSLKIHSNPELCLEEFKACKWQLEILRKLGFKIQNPFCGMKTAYKAVKGKGKPAVAFLAEYDALPEIGHACGHNLIAPCSIAAAEAFYQELKRIGGSGSVIILGTPAEEGKGGKIRMVEEGAFDGIDLALMAHPDSKTSEWLGFLAIRRFFVEFFGLSAHAAAAPEKGLNALDATMLMFHAVNAMRQHVKDGSRMHGIVNNGGNAPNIIPEYSSSTFYLRAATEKNLKEIVSRFQDIVKGAALMTGVKFKITEDKDSYKAGLTIKALNDEFISAATDAGLKNIVSKQGMGSSDFGDVSQVVPSLHAYFSVTDKQCPLHSKEFQKEAAKERAFEEMFKTAEILAGIAIKFQSNEAFRAKVSSEFKKNLKNCS